ncbi:MAG: hypothetical protein ACXWE0_09460, partial [Nitrososphaeraceae archaeon]
IDLKEYAGVYLPSKNDTILNKMEIRSVDNKLFRYIDKEPEGRNKNVELKLVTGHSFFYTDNSFRNIEFEVNAKKEVVGCTLTRWDGVYKLTKQK